MKNSGWIEEKEQRKRNLGERYNRERRINQSIKSIKNLIELLGEKQIDSNAN